jgi:hypothetical protein
MSDNEVPRCLAKFSQRGSDRDPAQVHVADGLKQNHMLPAEPTAGKKKSRPDLDQSTRALSARRSTNMKPRLCRESLYSTPGFPSPTSISMGFASSPDPPSGNPLYPAIGSNVSRRVWALPTLRSTLLWPFPCLGSLSLPARIPPPLPLAVPPPLPRAPLLSRPLVVIR